MEFRLTYEGPLYGASRSNTRATHKHEIRRVFHKQLTRLWQVSPVLKDWTLRQKIDFAQYRERHWADVLADEFHRNGYQFVPLICQKFRLLCRIDVLYLRPDPPGQIVQAGDVDGRLKTIFDALRIPSSKSELGGYDQPGAGEEPFFCLLEDDELISQASVEADTLLAPLPGKDEIEQSDAKVVIHVQIRRFLPMTINDPFG